jgi:hypothetical protein
MATATVHALRAKAAYKRYRLRAFVAMTAFGNELRLRWSSEEKA